MIGVTPVACQAILSAWGTLMDDMAVGLAEAIAALRKELTAAMQAGQDEDVRFRLGPVELEFELDVKRDVEAKGGVKFWVVSFEGKGQMARDSRHRIKLQLQPVGAEGADLRVASELAGRPR
jgi:hypothetical protein